MDAQLAELARVAEGGQECPRIKVIAGGVLYRGTPSPSSTMFELVDVAATQEFDANKRVWLRKPDATEVEAEKERYLGAFRLALTPEAETPTALTLAPCELFPLAGGDGLELVAVRVPLDAVSGWWILDGNRIAARGGWFVGATLPVGQP
jgi:hypothetical protein